MDDFELPMPPSLSPPRKRGRPPGVKNKAKPISAATFRKLYDRVEELLTEEQRRYYREAFAGKRELDPIKDAELFVRLLGLYTTEAIGWGIESREVTQDVAQLIGQYRMAIKDLEDMRRRREEWSAKQGTDGRVIDPLSQSESGNLADIVGQYSAERAG